MSLLDFEAGRNSYLCLDVPLNTNSFATILTMEVGMLVVMLMLGTLFYT